MNEGKVEYTFLWFIENCSFSWHKIGDRLLSPHFSTEKLEDTSWRLSIFLRGENDKHKDHISLYLRRNAADDGPEEFPLNFELSVLAAGSEGSTPCLKALKRTFKRNTGYGRGILGKLDTIPEDTLTVRCRVWSGEGEVRKFAPMCARTRFGVEKISFLHIVDSVSTLEPNERKTVLIRSHSKKGFFVSSSLCFRCDSYCEGEMILEITPSDIDYILCTRKISLLDASGNKILCDEHDNRFDGERKDIQKLPLSVKRQGNLNEESEYLPEDKLLLFCECAFSTGLEFEKIEDNEHELPHFALENRKRSVSKAAEKLSTYPSVSEDMKALYVNKCFTDVELKTKTKSFPAHRCVLCARSPIFKAMLTSDMKKKYNNWVQVDGLEDDIVERMLLFLYSDKIESLQWKIAMKLYHAGDKYQIHKLKAVCSSFLLENLTTTNAGQLLVQADAHSDRDLKKSVEDFIFEHEKEVFASKEWESLMGKNPFLVMKTMQLKYKR